MKKRLTSLLLALVMCIGLCVPAFATETVAYDPINAEEEIQRAMDGVSDVPVDQYVSEAYATVVDENNNEIQVPVQVTIREIPSNTRSGSTLYAITAVAAANIEQDHDETYLDNVQAYGTLYWENDGWTHRFYSCSGGWSCSNGAQTTDNNVHLSATDEASRDFSVGSSFNISQSQFDYEVVGTIRAITTALIRNKNQPAFRDKLPGRTITLNLVVHF